MDKDVLMPYLYKLVYKIFTLGCFQLSWSKGNVIKLHLLHKTGSLKEVNNNIGITLLISFGKL